MPTNPMARIQIAPIQNLINIGSNVKFINNRELDPKVGSIMINRAQFVNNIIKRITKKNDLPWNNPKCFQ